MLDVKFGACEFTLPGCSIGSVKLAKEVGLAGLQLDLGSYERGFLLSQKWIRDYYKEECDKYGIVIPSIAIVAFDNFGLRNPKGTEKGDMVYRIMDIAAEAAVDMKVEMIMVPSFVDGIIKTKEDMEITAKALKYICRAVASSGITVTTENTLTIEDNKKLIALVDEENITGFYDSENYWASNGWDSPKVLEELINANLLYPEIHLKDGIGNKCSTKLLGEGDSDFYGTMAVLKKYNYSGWLHLENFYDRPPLNVLSPQNYIAILQKDFETVKNACK